MKNSKKRPRNNLEIKECICGNHIYHTRGCKDYNRRVYQLAHQKAIRWKKRKDHVCIYTGCKTKIKPILVYPQYCHKHKPKKKASQ